MKKPSGHHQKSKDPSKTEQKETDKNEGRCYVCHKQGQWGIWEARPPDGSDIVCS